MKQDVFTSFEISKILGIPRGSIQQYMDRQIIHPSIAESTGQGSKNLFSKDDLYHLQILLYFQKYGFTQKNASKLSRQLITENYGMMIKGEWDYLLITNDKKPTIEYFYAPELHKYREKFKTTGAISILVNLYDIRQEVDSLIEKNTVR